MATCAFNDLTVARTENVAALLPFLLVSVFAGHGLGRTPPRFFQL